MSAYPDSAAGVRALLEEESDYFSVRDLTGATYLPDPQVSGAWQVRLPGGLRVIAYVGAHPEAPDFELMEEG